MTTKYADNYKAAEIDQPKVKYPSNLGYGKYRIAYDTIDFAVDNALIGDDIVIANVNAASVVTSNFKLYTDSVGMTAASTLQLGVLTKAATPVFTALATASVLTTADTPVQFDSIDAVAAAALPFSVAEDSYLVLRVAGANPIAGLVKAEVHLTVE